ADDPDGRRADEARASRRRRRRDQGVRQIVSDEDLSTRSSLLQSHTNGLSRSKVERMAIEGIIGKKVGMTQVFAEDGSIVPVTVVQAGPCFIVQKKTADKDGYDAVQLGLVEKVSN